MATPSFMFATGIENSYPTIHNGKERVDEMAKCGHYKHWRTDFDKVRELGLQFLRYGPPLHRTWFGPDCYDAICFLAADEARFITGTTLVVDGGRLDIL